MTRGTFRIPVYGGGGSSPDPDVYCPLHGYIPDPEIYRPPVVLPEVTEGSIVFVCNANIGNWRGNTENYQFSRTGTLDLFYEIFNAAGTLVDSFYDGLKIDFNFPTNDAYYTVRVSPQGTDTIIGFASGVARDPFDDSIEYAFINTPLANQFIFGGFRQFIGMEFSQEMTTLYALGYCFYNNRDLRYWNSQFDKLTYLSNVSYMFAFSKVLKVDLTALVSDLDDATSMLRDAVYLEEFIFPTIWKANKYGNFLQNTIRLKKITLPTTWSPSGTPNGSMAYFLDHSAVEGELEFPSLPYITSLANFAYYASNLEILRFKGDWSALTSVSGLALYASSLHTLELPRIMRASAALSSAVSSTTSALKYFLGPDVGYCGFPSNSGCLSVTGEHDTSGFSSYPIVNVSTVMRTTLEEFQCSKLRVQRFVMGTLTTSKFTALNAVEIDWANSDWSNATAPQLQIAAALDATELDRIMTALPTVTGKTLDFRYCDGYATMNASIATGKGWTVL